MKKLRLLLWEDCNRRCPGCCNKDWDLKNLPRIESPREYAEYDEILMTGGEPLLYPERVAKEAINMRVYGFRGRIYLYTAHVVNPLEVIALLNFVDGITLTLHDQGDVEPFKRFNGFLWMSSLAISIAGMKQTTKSLRLNIFAGVKINSEGINNWQTKQMVWQKNCPLPLGEVFKRLN